MEDEDYADKLLEFAEQLNARKDTTEVLKWMEDHPPHDKYLMEGLGEDLCLVTGSGETQDPCDISIILYRRLKGASTLQTLNVLRSSEATAFRPEVLALLRAHLWTKLGFERVGDFFYSFALRCRQ